MDRFSQTAAGLNGTDDSMSGTSGPSALYGNSESVTVETHNASAQPVPLTVRECNCLQRASMQLESGTSTAPQPTLPNVQRTIQRQNGLFGENTVSIFPQPVYTSLYSNFPTDACHDCRRDHQRTEQLNCSCTCHKEEEEMARLIASQRRSTSNCNCRVALGTDECPLERVSRLEDYPYRQVPAHPPFPCLLSPADRMRFVADWRRPLWPECLLLAVENAVDSGPPSPILPPPRPDSPNGPGSLLDITGDVRYAIL